MDGKQVFDEAAKKRIAELIIANGNEIIAENNIRETVSEKKNNKKQTTTSTNKKKRQ